MSFYFKVRFQVFLYILSEYKVASEVIDETLFMYLANTEPGFIQQIFWVILKLPLFFLNSQKLQISDKFY